MTMFYILPAGCMGLVNGTYILFATETEYIEYLRESQKGNRE